MKQPRHQVRDLLAPHLRSFGYSAPVESTLRVGTRQSTSTRFRGPDEMGLGLTPAVEVYDEDSYPNDRGEVFVHTWNACGMDARHNDLVRHLCQGGLRARVTTRRGYCGIAVEFPDFRWS